MDVRIFQKGLGVSITERAPDGCMIEVDPELIRELKGLTGELRHAYTHLKAERVTREAELADGLISPQIERLERIIASLEGSDPARPKPDDA